MRHFAQFRANWSNRCLDITVFQWQPCAILDLLYACLDHSRSAVGGLYRVQNLVGIGCVVLKLWEFQCYASLA